MSFGCVVKLIEHFSFVAKMVLTNGGVGDDGPWFLEKEN